MTITSRPATLDRPALHDADVARRPHVHAHDGHPHRYRPTALATGAIARLLRVGIALAALWLAVAWALL